MIRSWKKNKGYCNLGANIKGTICGSESVIVANQERESFEDKKVSTFFFSEEEPMDKFCTWRYCNIQHYFVHIFPRSLCVFMASHCLSVSFQTEQIAHSILFLKHLVLLPIK